MSGYQLTKNHGQHFLTNTAVIQNIVRLAEIRSSDTVLEIGPGSGNLTMHLLPVAKHVIAIEIDPRMVSELKKRVPPELRSKLTVISGDFCKMPEIPPFDICVSNCPYNVSSSILFKLLSLAHTSTRIRKFTLMFQLEFCQGIVAEPNQSAYSRLSVNTRLLAKSAKIILKVGPQNFTPPPKVDSAVVEVIPQTNQNLSMQEYLQFEGLTRVCFSKKNRQLSAIFGVKFLLKELVQNYILANKKQITTEELKILIAESIAENTFQEIRSAKMSVDDFLMLLSSLTKRGVYFA
ncbi:Dimethyladenosine transferase [Spironucleus salmonicida]|uniref:rRNA adenine N(6)-methyltransferase n=1 Tax=Spironucleus salmonicida TaxID=348837 RepID=V6LQF9_9EUKA|nr:Dimethyladenosine transferase [Spironucleus salmonicida]|eukprot:EST46907.1 Dimethyladenosine transferase [Spironucleus salmonicida]